MFDELAILRDKRQRSRVEPDVLRAALVSAGASVLELRSVSRIVPDPFSGLRLFPMLYEIRVAHDLRRGCWYVRTGGDTMPPEWVWHDADGYGTSPLPALGDASAVDLVAISWARDWLVVIG